MPAASGVASVAVVAFEEYVSGPTSSTMLAVARCFNHRPGLVISPRQRRRIGARTKKFWITLGHLRKLINILCRSVAFRHLREELEIDSHTGCSRQCWLFVAHVSILTFSTGQSEVRLTSYQEIRAILSAGVSRAATSARADESSACLPCAVSESLPVDATRWSRSVRLEADIMAIKSIFELAEEATGWRAYLQSGFEVG